MVMKIDCYQFYIIDFVILSYLLGLQDLLFFAFSKAVKVVNNWDKKG